MKARNMRRAWLSWRAIPCHTAFASTRIWASRAFYATVSPASNRTKNLVGGNSPLSGVGFSGGHIMMDSFVGYDNAAIHGLTGGPGFWQEGPQRQWGLVQQGPQDQNPAAAKDTDQAQAGGSMLPALAGQCAETSSRVPSGLVSLAAPPTLISYKVATATGSPRRTARCGLVMRVRCHCHPARLVSLKPCSIQARRPYQQASPTSGGKSVRINQGSLQPASQQANSSAVHTGPVPTCGVKVSSG